MSRSIPFTQIARLPDAADNVAIATRRLEAGTVVQLDAQTVELDHTVLEGHRFAVQPIVRNAHLLSWGLPFGTAVIDIRPGQYVCNEATLTELNSRSVALTLPAQGNFSDLSRRYRLDDHDFQPSPPLPHVTPIPTFQGFPRPQGRGTGTRNHIILLATTSRAAAFVRRLAEQLQPHVAGYDNIDGVVAVAHTEGDTPQPNNRTLLLRTLAGWLVHPNVGAAFVVDTGAEGVDNDSLRTFMQQHAYPLAGVPHEFFTLGHGFDADLERASAHVQGWFDTINAVSRTAVPVSELKIALQCGGSDAFSGVSGNPLAAWVAKALLERGGSANLAETDELMGAEPYILRRVRDRETAEKFLATLERFRSWANRHGVSPEGNPSGGNRFRGLYNIALKSIGAANKKHPEVPLTAVIDYSEPMTEPGFYFMDSPGNDLESIAGQVAAGCNLIFFVTGNGSITNFPFVPTLKIVTTSERFALLQSDMDINAGRFLDGSPLAEIGTETFALMQDTASGQVTAGEQAGHTQVQIWRDWHLTRDADLKELAQRQEPRLQPPLTLLPASPPPFPEFQAVRTGNGLASEPVGLILPTSLCAGQIARMAVDHLSGLDDNLFPDIARFATLTHTEGCGFSSGAFALFNRTLIGYLQQPLVKRALLLEHGCEKTHNDYFRQELRAAGIDATTFGWASIQMDGGIEKVMAKMTRWFLEHSAGTAVPLRQAQNPSDLTIAILSDAKLSTPAARMLSETVQQIAGAGGTVLLPQHFNPLNEPDIAARLVQGDGDQPTLAYADRPSLPGLHVMATPTHNWTEILTGLGAAGASIIVAYCGPVARQGHPLVPTLQVASAAASINHDDFDVLITEDDVNNPVSAAIAATLTGSLQPRALALGNVNFQLTRGYLGISV